jgi:hypothetical protein
MKIDYNGIFTKAKESTIHTHAMVWIREIAEDRKKTDREKFIEIQKIIIEAVKHLEV